MSDLVSYQQGSIVSRVLLKREKGNLSLFAFDCGQGLSEHTTPFDALAQAIEGEAEITIGGKLVAVKAGEIILLPGAAASRRQGHDSVQDAPDYESILSSLPELLIRWAVSNHRQFCRIAACHHSPTDKRSPKSPSFPA